MGARASEIHRGRKFDQVVAGARTIFLQDGFEGASVDDIARAAGVSKATLYKYFPDKRLLFMEVATEECRRQGDGDCVIDTDKPPREVLSAAADRLMSLYLSDVGRAVFRIAVAEADRFPGLGQEFWKNGPARARTALIGYFRIAVARGELRVEDLDLAADQFTELCKVDLYPRLLMGLDREFTADARSRVVEGAVDMFLARYGT